MSLYFPSSQGYSVLGLHEIEPSYENIECTRQAVRRNQVIRKPFWVPSFLGEVLSSVKDHFLGAAYGQTPVHIIIEPIFISLGLCQGEHSVIGEKYLLGTASISGIQEDNCIILQ